MFEKDLTDKLKRIFKLEKITLNAISDSNEQLYGFVSISLARGSIRERKYLARVAGTLTVYGNTERLKYGFFSRAMDQASKEDMSSFYFYDVEENANVSLTVAARSISFVFFFNGQYDPDVGTLESVTIEQVEDEE